MSLARAWRRQLSEAWTAALLVPGTLVAALLVLAFAGGFGRLGALGQAFSGPSLPGVAPTAQGNAGGGTATANAPAIAPLGTVHASTASSAAGGAAATSPGPSSSGGSRSGGTSGHGGTGPAPVHHTSPGNPVGSGPATPTPAPPPTAPAPKPTLVDRVVDLGTSITSKIPGPVGSVTTQTLQSVGSALDRIIPIRARAGTPGSASR